MDGCVPKMAARARRIHLASYPSPIHPQPGQLRGHREQFGSSPNPTKVPCMPTDWLADWPAGWPADWLAAFLGENFPSSDSHASAAARILCKGMKRRPDDSGLRTPDGRRHKIHIHIVYRGAAAS